MLSVKYHYIFTEEPDVESCRIPESVRKTAYCTFWLNYAQFNKDYTLLCAGYREVARKCFKLETKISSTTSHLTVAESMTTEMSTKLENISKDDSAKTEDSTLDPAGLASVATSEAAT